jgi:hypothetical protein
MADKTQGFWHISQALISLVDRNLPKTRLPRAFVQTPRNSVGTVGEAVALVRMILDRIVELSCPSLYGIFKLSAQGL